MDISEEIEASFGDGPAHRTLEDRLSAGRRARRRRKGAEGVAAIAGAAVLGLAAYAVVPGGTPDSAKEPGFAGQPSGSGSATGESAWKESSRDGDTDTPVEVEMDRNGKDLWVQFTGRPRFKTGDQWRVVQPALSNGGEQLPYVKFGTGEELKPMPGVEIVQQQADPDVGEGNSQPGERTAAAEVLVNGETWFVLARQVGDAAPEYFLLTTIGGQRTLAEFLDYARSHDVSGEGRR